MSSEPRTTPEASSWTWAERAPLWADERLVSLMHLALREHRNSNQFYTALELLRAMDAAGYRVVKD